MGTHRYIRRKASLESVSTPAPNPFKTRPFGKGLQARQAELPETNLLQTRPVSSPHQASSEQQEMPDLQTQLESAERFGYNAANIPVLDPSTAPPIQAKLAIGQPNDQYEQEADRVAAQVVEQINSPQTQQSTPGQAVQRDEMPAPEEEEQPVQAKLESGTIQREEMPAPEEEEQPVQAKLGSGTIQREEMPPPEEEEEPVQAKLESGTIQREEMPPPEEEEEPVQAKLESSAIQREEMPPPEEEEEQPIQAKLESGTIQREEMPPPEEEEEQPIQAKLMVQRKPAEGGMAATPDLEESIESARGGGQSLSENIRQPMEQAMGADLSGVRIHTDSQSDELNRSIQARAFTTGQDVFFRQGEYDPGSRGGQELMAHEFTHYLQQNPSVAQRKIQRQDATEQQNQTNPSDTQTTQPYGICTEFGNFEVYPDDFVGPLPRSDRAQDSWPIRQSSYDQLIARLTTVKDGSSKLTVIGTNEFTTATYLDLGWLMTSSVGQDLIQQLQDAAHTVTIQETGSGNATSYDPDADSWEVPGTPPTPGPGANVTVYYNPHKLQIGDGSEDWMTRPPAIGLAHELVHAWTGVYGTRAKGNDDAGVKRREQQATGIAEFRDARISENRFRAAFGLPLRPVY